MQIHKINAAADAGPESADAGFDLRALRDEAASTKSSPSVITLQKCNEWAEQAVKDSVSFPEELVAAARCVTLVNFASQALLLEDMAARLRARRGFAVATLNLDHLVKLRQSAAFRAAYARHSHIVADGHPVVWTSRLARRPVELVTGSDLILPLAGLAAQLGVPVALFGSTAATLETAAARMTAVHPGLNVVCRIAPPYGFDPQGAAADAALDEIRRSGARLCLLALGAPKQEVFAARGIERLPECGFVSIGAGLDFIAGRERRAPPWVRRIAMEWFWRMASNPKRLIPRYWSCIMILPGLTLSALREGRQRGIR